MPNVAAESFNPYAGKEVTVEKWGANSGGASRVGLSAKRRSLDAGRGGEEAFGRIRPSTKALRMIWKKKGGPKELLSGKESETPMWSETDHLFNWS